MAKYLNLESLTDFASGRAQTTAEEHGWKRKYVGRSLRNKDLTSEGKKLVTLVTSFVKDKGYRAPMKPIYTKPKEHKIPRLARKGGLTFVYHTDAWKMSIPDELLILCDYLEDQGYERPQICEPSLSFKRDGRWLEKIWLMCGE